MIQIVRHGAMGVWAPMVTAHYGPPPRRAESALGRFSAMAGAVGHDSIRLAACRFGAQVAKPTLLVLDDKCAPHFQSFLGQAGYHVWAACSVEEACQLAGAHQPDMFLIDSNLGKNQPTGAAFIAFLDTQGVPRTRMLSISTDDAMGLSQWAGKWFLAPSQIGDETYQKQAGKLLTVIDEQWAQQNPPD